MTSSQQNAKLPDVECQQPLPLHAFPPPTIYPPLKEPHKQTIIFLHGRGYSARTFAPSLLAAAVEPGPGSATLREALPHARFVFPTAPRSRATVYRRSIINQWYDGSGDWEETVLGHALETVEFVHGLLRAEIALAGGGARVALGGFSQGCAAALVCLLLWEGEKLGGFVGFCGMLPMANVMGEILGEREAAETEDCSEDDVFGAESDQESDPFDRGVGTPAFAPRTRALNLLREEIGLHVVMSDSDVTSPKTPIFLGHGTEDDSVLLRYGEKASRVLQMTGYSVDFQVYQALDHWYSTAMLSDSLRFLRGLKWFEVSETGQ
ncbi:Acyl-protein thioesterase 1 [Colletotrichum sidae]|uniref:Acyl-protein thioesterase 1 n=1 Tax=Colletotrichum sidae TaxID=1347389 RepID=A0A4V3I3U7_9PEZI|nr:Acyl-protein thioesterase 1 [Colletotrichum sidae]